MQKVRKSKNSIPVFFCFVIFWAVRFSHNLKLKYRYINIIIAVLQPPCWCYGGDSFIQKDRKSKNIVHMFFCFAIFWAVQYSCNLELKYRYINIITAILQPHCWCYGGDSIMKKDRTSKNSVPVFFCFEIFWALRFSHSLELLYIQICNNSWFMATLLEIWRWVFHAKR